MFLAVGEPRSLVEQGADAVGPDFGRGMVPAETADTAVPLRQDMLEKTADQFVGGQVQVSPLTGLIGAVGPADFSVGQKVQAAIAGGGLEEVAGQVAESFFTRTDGLGVHDPALGPDFFGDLGEEFRSLIFKFLSEERATDGSGRTAAVRLVFEVAARVRTATVLS